MVSVRLPNKATIAQANQCGTLTLNIGMWNTVTPELEFSGNRSTQTNRALVTSAPPPLVNLIFYKLFLCPDSILLSIHQSGGGSDMASDHSSCTINTIFEGREGGMNQMPDVR